MQPLRIRPKQSVLVSLAAWLFTSYAGAAQLEEIVVTATKRAENIQDIPMSIEAVSGEQLTQDGIVGLDQLADSIPNVIIGEGVTTSSIAMRGQSTGQDRSLEQSVGMFIDGMYMPRSKQYQAPFFDVERVEILRGPQAVLFGLNSTAGAISIHTVKNRPGDAFEASITAGYEVEYGEVRSEVVVGGSPTENLGLRMAVKYSDQEDGFFYNEFTGNHDDGRDSVLVRLSSVWEPATDIAVTVKYEHSKYDIPGSAGETIENSFSDLDFKRFDDLGSSANKTFDGVRGFSESGRDTESDAIVVNLEWMLGEHTLTAVAGYSEFEFDMVMDFDLLDLRGLATSLGTVPGMFHSAILEDFEQKSFEVRLVSPEDLTVSYIIGAYYQESDLENSQPNVINDISLGALFGFDGGSRPLLSWWELAEASFEQHTETMSAFASVTWNVSNRWRVTLGARYNDEDKALTRNGEPLVVDPLTRVITQPDQSGCGASGGLPASDCQFVFIGPTAAGAYDRNSKNFMPELIVQWDLSETSQVYGKIGESAKSGGFSSSTVVARERVEYDDEIAQGLEVGIRNNLWDNRAELNASIFYNTIEDLQVSSFDPVSASSSITNAGENVSWGIEVDGKVAAMDWLILGASMAYLHTEFDNFEDGPCGSSKAEGPDVNGRCDLTGLTPPFAPEFSGSVFADVLLPLTDTLNLTGGVRVSYSDEYFVEGSLSPQFLQNSWTKVNARLGLSSADDNWAVSIIGTNLTEEITSNYGIGLISDAGYPSAPRQVILQGSYRF